MKENSNSSSVVIYPEIKDSGNRRQFNSGAVRDIETGKGRCDLLPVDVVASLMVNRDQCLVLTEIGQFMSSGQDRHLFAAIRRFADLRGWSLSECLLEVSKHYEAGATKYGERNWEKGIDLHSFIDSGIRHFLKFIDNKVDEPHDRAFVWNMLCAIWTMKHHPNLIDIPFNLLNQNKASYTESCEGKCESSSVSAGAFLHSLMEAATRHNN